MLYIYAGITALLLVTGQSLWKNASILFNSNQNVPQIIIKLIFSWQFILGAFLYVIATLIYIWLFSKFDYHSVQLSLITFSVLLSIAIAAIFFKENIYLINYIGGAVIVLGLILATWKK